MPCFSINVYAMSSNMASWRAAKNLRKSGFSSSCLYDFSSSTSPNVVMLFFSYRLLSIVF